MRSFETTDPVRAESASDRRRPWIVLPLLTALMLPACGSQPESSALAPGYAYRAQERAVLADQFSPKSASPAAEGRGVSGGMMGGMMVSATNGRGGRGGPNLAENMLQEVPGGAIAKSAREDRKIIYTATVDLVTDDLNALEPKLLTMVRESGGFVAETNQSGSAGGQRSATWRIRVPVDAYDGFLQKTRSLGEVRSVRVESQDVTEEFVDVTARVGAKKVQEQRLIDLIKNATGNLEEVLKVEGELARVRSEIERMEGRLRVLKDQTDLTTVTVSVSEIKDYVPPEAPTFGTKIGRTWKDSTLTLQRNLGEFVLGAVAWAPFLPFYIIGWGLFLWLLWRGWRKIRPLVWAELRSTIQANPIVNVPKRDDQASETP